MAEVTALDPSQIKESLSRLCNTWANTEAEIEVLIEATKEKGKEVNRIKTDEIPQLMRAAGTSVWVDDQTGRKIELETSVNASLPKDLDKRNEMLNALRPIGINEIVGEEYNLTFLPDDSRTEALRMLLGIKDEEQVIEDAAPPPSKLTNSQIDAIQQVREMLGWDKQDMPVESKLGVHPSRLKAWLKRKIDAGHGQQVTDAGIWFGKVAKKTESKKKG